MGEDLNIRGAKAFQVMTMLLGMAFWDGPLGLRLPFVACPNICVYMSYIFVI
jgi:hypothetical protein